MHNVEIQSQPGIKRRNRPMAEPGGRAWREERDQPAIKRRNRPAAPGAGHMTSGASETIFMNFFSRSSRATGPKMRVAAGSPASLTMTAALSSKRM